MARRPVRPPAVVSVVQAAVRAAQGVQRVTEEVSYASLAEEVAGIDRGLRIALPAAGAVSAGEGATRLRERAAQMRRAAFGRHPRGPKKPPPPF